ncbi:MAG: hypothetical protein SNG35_02365 [Rikenellaceae bacterium]
MKTTIKFPNGLVESGYNSTLVSLLVSIIATGIMLIISYNLIDFEDDTIISTLIISGVLATIIAAAILSFQLKQTILASNGSPLICKTIEFKESEYIEVRESIADKRWSEIKNVINRECGVAMKMELVYTKDKSFAAYQFFKYVPHSFEPCSEVVYLDKDSAFTNLI